MIERGSSEETGGEPGDICMQGGMRNTRVLKWLESGGSRRVVDLMTRRWEGVGRGAEENLEQGNDPVLHVTELCWLYLWQHSAIPCTCEIADEILISRLMRKCRTDTNPFTKDERTSRVLRNSFSRQYSFPGGVEGHIVQRRIPFQRIGEFSIHSKLKCCTKRAARSTLRGHVGNASGIERASLP